MDKKDRMISVDDHTNKRQAYTVSIVCRVFLFFFLKKYHFYSLKSRKNRNNLQLRMCIEFTI